MTNRTRKCKAIIDGKKCGKKFTAKFEQHHWCCEEHRDIIIQEKLAKVRAKQAVKEKKAKEEKAKEKRKAHKKRKQELKPIKWFHDKARKACNDYVRYRDRNDICISCEKPLAFETKYDAGHWKTQGAHKWIAYDEMNVNGQCVECNQYKSGNEAAQRPRLIEKWGLAEVERLEQSGKNLGEKSYTRDDLLEIESYYKKKLKDLKDG